MIVTNEQQLRIKSELFQGTPEDLANLIANLENELENSPNPGVGLAAIQIGIPVRVGIIRTAEMNIDLVNPEIIDGYEMVKLIEGCLSFPGQFVNVMRMTNITIINNGFETIELSGFVAQAVQHEIDHMDGLTMFDRRV